MDESLTRAYIPTLDGWRAVAVGLVIGAHSCPMLMNSGNRAAQLLASGFNHAGVGVDVFFALSGYLICGQLLSEKQRQGTIDLLRFYLRRAFRILPPILVYVAVIVSISSLHVLPHIEGSDLLGTLFFYRNYLMGGWYTAHFWSLAVEEQFYAVIPLCLLLLDRRWAWVAAFALIALCIGIRWFEYSHGFFADALIQFRTENRFDGLLWGCVLALALQQPTIRASLQKHLNAWVFFLLIAVLVVLLVEFNSAPVRRTLVAASMPLLIAYTRLHADGRVGRFLELPLMKWLGRLSYSLYIWQMAFLVPGVPLGVLQRFPLNLIGPLVCALLSFYLVEKPMIRMGRRWASSTRPAQIERVSQ